MTANQAARLPVELLDFGAGQFPIWNLLLRIPAKWGTLATEGDSTDIYRGRPIIPQTEFDAGFIHRLVPMGRWTLNESGLGNFISWDEHAQTIPELALGACSGVNKFVKVSDHGYREPQQEGLNLDRQQAAENKVALPPEVREALIEFYRLKQLGTRQTSVQEVRAEQLGIWYNSIYRPQSEIIQTVIDEKDPAALRAACFAVK